MENWEVERAFDKSVNSIAALSVKYPRKVGIEGGMVSAFATAFVVSYKPLVLVTNKHVMTCAGLAQIKAVFLTRPLKDTVDLKVIYIDPVHDFVLCGVATKSKNHNLFSPLYPLQPLSLANNIPENGSFLISIGASKGKTFNKFVGKVVNNQADPPNGMDFNLGHIEGSDKSPRGFSGGPVVDKNGKVIAIVASNFEDRSLHIPAVAVKKILKVHVSGHKIPRGTLNLAFNSEVSYLDKEGDELDESRTKFIVTKCMGDSDKVLIGDEISKIKGKEVTSLSQIEDILNSHVGKEISYELLRSSKSKSIQKIKFKTRVQNLHEFQIPKILEISGTILHTPEYNVLMFYNLDPIFKKALFVSDQGFLFKQFDIPLHCLIIGVGNINLLDTPTKKKEVHDSYTSFLDGIKEYLSKGQYMIPIVYKILGKAAEYRKVFVFQPRWYPTVVYYLDLQQQWRREIVDLSSLLLQNNTANAPDNAGENTEPEILDVDIDDIDIEEMSQGPGRLLGLIVHIRFIQPFELDGNNKDSNYLKQAAGVVIDSHRGLIVCERYLVNSALGDCIVTFDGRRSVVGNVILVHPTQMFSIIKVNKQDLAKNGIVIPPVNLTRFLSNNPLTIADNLSYIGLTMKHSKIYCKNVSVTTREPILPRIQSKFTARNSCYFTTSLSPSSTGLGGFFFNERTKKLVGLNVHFLSLNTFCGIQSYSILNSVVQLVGSKLQSVDILPISLTFPLLADAKVSHSIPDTTEMTILEEMGDFHRTMLLVESFFPRAIDETGLLPEPVCDLVEGDLILSVNNQTVTSLQAFEANVRADDAHNTIEVIDQSGNEAKRDLRHLSIPAVEINQVIVISGAVFHNPTLHLLSYAEKNTNQLQPAAVLSEVYPGSPAASVFSLQPGEVKLVSSVDGERLANFDHFTISINELFKAIMDGENIAKVSFNLSDEDLDDFEKVSISVAKDDLLFWPPRHIKRDPKTLAWAGEDLFHVKLKPKSKKKNSRKTPSIASKGSKAKKKALNVFRKGSNLKKKFRGKRKKSISST